MDILINEKKIDIYIGARVGYALLTYSKEEFKNVLSGTRKIVNKDGVRQELSNELKGKEFLRVIDN